MTDAVRAYREALDPDHEDVWVRRELADAAIAALVAELERLRCCGNCGRFVIDCDDLETYCPNGDGTFTRCYIQDHCHFTPSRWKEAER